MADIRPPRPSLSRRLSGGIKAATENADRFKTPLGLAVLALGAFLAYTAFKATTGPPFEPKYRITIKVPADAPPLRRGEAVRVGGSLAGLINAVEPDPVHHRTLVTVNISKTNFRPLPADTTAFVRVHSIVYLTYVALTPGTSHTMLRDGDTLAATAQSGTDLLEVVQLFDKTARENLSKTLVNVGFGVAGRGADLNAALHDLPGTARYGASELRAATSTPGALSELIAGAEQTADALRGERPDDVSGLIGSADKVFSAIADRNAALGEAIRQLRPFEDQVVATGPTADAALDEIGHSATALTPAVRNLAAQLPALNRLATRGPELRKGFAALLGGGAGGSAGGGGGGSVGTGSTTSGIANQVLIAARPVIYGLFPVQTALRPLNASLAQLLKTIDPYLPEIDQAGKWLQSATGVRVNRGKNPGAPSLRGVLLLTPHSCQDPEPDPGQAQKDQATSSGACK